MYLEENNRVGKSELAPEQDKLLKSCLDKIKESLSITELDGVHELYEDVYLRAKDVEGKNYELRLRTIRINDAARLFYTIHNRTFFPLDVCWDHKLYTFSLLQDPKIRNTLAQKIIDKVLMTQSQTVPELNKTVEKTTESSSKRLSKKSIVQLTPEQASVLGANKTAKAILCFGPPGTGKTEVAKELLTFSVDELTTRYFTLGSGLCSQVNNDVSSLVESANQFRCETWDDLLASLREVFNDIKTHLEEQCRLEGEAEAAVQRRS